MTSKIQETVCKHLAMKGYEAICENFCYNWEMDVAALSKSNMLHEYEVKISRSDFLADKKQKSIKFSHFEIRNERTIPNYFFYVCPEGMISESEIPVWAGLYYFSKAEGEITMIKNAKKLHKSTLNHERILRKMLRLNVQRKYLGGSMMTYLNRKSAEKYKNNCNKTANSIYLESLNNELI